VRFDFCSDENGSEVRTTLREAVRNYERPFGTLGRVDINKLVPRNSALIVLPMG